MFNRDKPDKFFDRLHDLGYSIKSWETLISVWKEFAASLKLHRYSLRDFLSLIADWDQLSEEEQQCVVPPDPTRINYIQIAAMYHTLCPSYPKIQSITEKRKKEIRTTMKKGISYEDFAVIFKKAEESDFLKGRCGPNPKTGKPWSARFDDLIKHEKAVGVLEGKYDNREAPVKSSASYDMTELEALTR